jgi:putative heme-binding domain-containing protein
MTRSDSNRQPAWGGRILGAAILAVATIGAAAPAWAQRDSKDVPDPDPEIERQSFQVADGFEVSLFAADPLLAKPIEMAFGADGRLWVASSEVYPQVKPGQQVDDKVLVLEDSDGDGKADKTTIFARGLLIPTGVEPGDGGAYVANSTEIVFLKDTDGDGQADFSRVMLSGFGTEDTHHIVHTFRWGPDGMLYFNQSVYIHSHIETPHGVRRLGGGGIWQFRPETLELDVFMRGSWNPWGHAWDRWGQSFVTDGAGSQGVMYAFPGATFEPSPGASRFLPGLNPGSPKLCGLEIVSGRHLPDDWQGSLVTCDFRAHRVCRYVVSEDGSGFASREQAEVVKSTHPAFRPIDVKMGPDGAIYIADWYNPIIQHGEVDFRDPRRDHTHGRIWRVTAKGRPLVERPKLADASTAALLAQLKSPEGWTRQFAKRILKERGADIVPELTAWGVDLAQAHPDYEHHLLEALWTYQALDIVDSKLLERLLHAEDPHARAAAVRVLGQWQARMSDPLEFLHLLVADENPRVRLETVRALAAIGTVEAAQVAMRALERPMDRFLEHALYLTMRDLQPVWLPALDRGQIDFGGDARQLAFALSAAGSADVVGPLVKLITAGKLPAERRTGALLLLATVGGPKELDLVFDEALAANATLEQQAQLLHSLAVAARERRIKPAGNLDRLLPLVDSRDRPVRLAAIETAGAWRLASAFEMLVALAKNREPLEDRTELRRLELGFPNIGTPRVSALRALAALDTPECRRVLLELSTQKASEQTAEAVAALTLTDPVAAAKPAIKLIEEVRQIELIDLKTLFGAFADRKGGSAALVAALDGQTLSQEKADAAIGAVRELAVPQPALVDALAKAGRIGQPVGLLDADQRKQLVADVAAQGNAARGENIFRSARLGCLKCHAIGGAGGSVGPDLMSLGASAQPDYILDSILDPSAKIKENYHALTVTTDDGHVYSGIKLRELDGKLVLRDAEDHEISIPLNTIDERVAAKSLMPVGLADSLSRAQLVDLVRFLSELGRVGAFSIGPERVVRRWEMAVDTSATSHSIDENGLNALASRGDVDWTPVYSRVSGELSAKDVTDVPAFEEGAGASALRFQLEVTTPGPVRLKTPPGLITRLWIDSKPQKPTEELTLDLTAGLHTVTLTIHKWPALLKIELQDVPGSKARAQIVGGK